VSELKAAQGKPVDIGGYYLADADKYAKVMRPSPTFNAALKSVKSAVAEVA
jgi:isocitrate dehydrogenase